MRSPENCEGSEVEAPPRIPSDTPPNPAQSDRSDESETNAEALATPTNIAELVGPPNVPAPLLDPMPKDEHGRPDWTRLAALLAAAEALCGANLATEARPLLAQARGIVEAARGPRARVIELASRSRG